jgi:hypothetical protein
VALNIFREILDKFEFIIYSSLRKEKQYIPVTTLVNAALE